ncbi:MAG: ABC transporter permease [Proteobacteria bacterium]|nr:ABC transporter permease [Pseudomonadota bacterium]
MTRRLSRFPQERIVVATAIALAGVFSLLSSGFLEIGNLISLFRNVSILGILALAMSLVVIGRGIDLAMIATMVISSAYFIVLYSSGHSALESLLAGLLIATAVGVIQGCLIAYAEIPPLFATLAVGVAVFGFGQLFLVGQDVTQLPQGEQVFQRVGSLRVLGVPVQIFALLAVALAVFGFLTYTKYGRFIYGLGENPATARLIGISTRVLTVGKYCLCSILAFMAGILTVSSVASMSLRIYNSTMIYDVILVVVIGGVGLNGGKGGVKNVFAGTLLIGTLLNGMTLMDVPYAVQNILKGLILLFALMADSYLNPRDEQTERQGDI